MKRLRLTVAIALVAFGVVLAGTARDARAVVIYDFVGACTVGCSGVSNAILTLTDGSSLNSGVLDNTNFVSFVYGSNTSPLFFVPGNAMLGTFSAVGDGFFSLQTTGGPVDLEFLTQPGLWRATFTSAAAAAVEQGDEFLISVREVPEPASIALLLAGLLGLALVKRRNDARGTRPAIRGTATA